MWTERCLDAWAEEYLEDLFLNKTFEIAYPETDYLVKQEATKPESKADVKAGDDAGVKTEADVKAGVNAEAKPGAKKKKASGKTVYGILSFFGVEVAGDVSVCKKKSGLARPIFELRLDLDWKIDLPVENGKSFVDTKGEFSVVEFSSEDPDDIQIKTTCDYNIPDGSTPVFEDIMDNLHDMAKNEGLKEVKRMLREDFMNALLEVAEKTVD